MTDTRDPRYMRTAGLTLLAALLVVASCQVEQLSTNIEVEQVTPVGVEEPLPTTDAEPETVQADPTATEPEPEVVDEVRAAIEALRRATIERQRRATDTEPLVPVIQAAPVFTPMTVRPEILNVAEVQAALMREYPPLLRDAGIGGSVTVWFFISEQGTVLDRRVSESSGHVPLDNAALNVADVFRFSPALNREQVVEVWIRMPITFQVQ